MARHIGTDLGVGLSTGNLGYRMARRGDLKAGKVFLGESLETLTRAGLKRVAADTMDFIAEVAMIEGDRVRAVRLFAATDSIREVLGVPVELTQIAQRGRSIAELKAHLDETSFEREWARGQGLGFSKAYNYAMGTIPSVEDPRLHSRLSPPARN